MTNNEVLQTMQGINTMYLQYAQAKLNLIKKSVITDADQEIINSVTDVTEQLLKTHNAILKLYNGLP